MALTMVLFACGGADPLAAYVDEVVAITRQMTQETLTALPPGAAPTRPQVEAVTAARRRAAEAISALAVPQEMSPEHIILERRLIEFVDASESFLAATADLDANGFLEALLGSTGLDTVAGAAAAACAVWERRAADLGTAVMLTC